MTKYQMNQVLNETEICLFWVIIIAIFEAGKQPREYLKDPQMKSYLIICLCFAKE